MYATDYPEMFNLMIYKNFIQKNIFVKNVSCFLSLTLTVSISLFISPFLLRAFASSEFSFLAIFAASWCVLSLPSSIRI